MCAYEYAPASEPKLTSPSEVQEAIRGSRLERLRARIASRQSAEAYPKKIHNLYHEIL
jgi:hypothetical protein